MRTAAVLPVKRFALAKQRLGAAVAGDLRRELAGAMLADVLAALAQARTIELTVVVTSERAAAGAAREHRAMLVEDRAASSPEGESGQSAAAALGIRHALAARFERVLCVPGDCPTLDPKELDTLLGEHAHENPRPEVVIVPDRHGTGTNGLVLAPPGAIPPSFGPGSCERHRLLARAAGARCRVARAPSLLLDIDTGDDLEVLRARLAAQRTGAPRTRAVLGLPDRAVELAVPTTA